MLLSIRDTRRSSDLGVSLILSTVSIYTHPPCMHKYCDFRSWWTAVAWYLTDQQKSDQVSRSLWLWRCVIWRAGWMLTNRGQLRWINYLIIQWRRHMYHQWWKLISIWVTFLAIKSAVVTSVATINTLWTWHDECNMSMWWCCVHVILFYLWPTKGGSQFFCAKNAFMFEFQ